jgi:rhodanese-related sulfurtransferase
MAKQQHHPPQQSSSKSTMAILVVGALIVVGLVVWALTRTVEAPPAPVTESSVADAGSAPAPNAGVVSTTAVSEQTPIASSTAQLLTTSDPHGDRPNHDAFPRISAEDLREKDKAHKVLIVDVRATSAYEVSHIPGSLSIPLTSVESSLDLLPKDKNAEIVLYCTCPAEESAVGAGLIMNRYGYKNVTALFGGLVAWHNLGYPTEKGAPK